MPEAAPGSEDIEIGKIRPLCCIKKVKLKHR